MPKTLSTEDFAKVFGKVEDIKIRLWHMHSLADLLVAKYQELVDAKKIIEDEYSSPILSIAEMLKEKSEASLRDIDEIDIRNNGILSECLAYRKLAKRD